MVEESIVSITKSGKLIQGPKGPVHNPFLSILFRAQREMRAAGAELGLSPSARARLVAQPEISDADRVMEMLLGGGGDPADEWRTN